jgi:hypothetical protein
LSNVIRVKRTAIGVKSLIDGIRKGRTQLDNDSSLAVSRVLEQVMARLHFAGKLASDPMLGNNWNSAGLPSTPNDLSFTVQAQTYVLGLCRAGRKLSPRITQVPFYLQQVPREIPCDDFLQSKEWLMVRKVG